MAPARTTSVGWPVRDLRSGMVLEEYEGTLTHLTSIIREHRPAITVYNFEVTRTHTYFAGRAEVLVHNCPTGGAPSVDDPNSLEGLHPDEVRQAIPNDWEGPEPTRDGSGERWFRPETNRSEGIRIMSGDPSATDPLHQGPLCCMDGRRGRSPHSSRREPATLIRYQELSRLEQEVLSLAAEDIFHLTEFRSLEHSLDPTLTEAEAFQRMGEAVSSLLATGLVQLVKREESGTYAALDDPAVVLSRDVWVPQPGNPNFGLTITSLGRQVFEAR